MRPASQKPKKSPLREGLAPTLGNFAGWLVVFVIAVFISASFGFEVASAERGGDKGPALSLMSLVWTAFGWIPLAIIIFRFLRR
jgi:hypothetical protein